jgi:hypothetical protein
MSGPVGGEAIMVDGGRIRGHGSIVSPFRTMSDPHLAFHLRIRYTPITNLWETSHHVAMTAI